MDESKKYETFFDIGVSENNNKKFAFMKCTIFTDRRKKRVINHDIVKRYFDNKPLNEEESVRLKKILDGSIYSERRKLYSHCKLCTDDFERTDFTNFTKQYKYWEICVPTFPYFVGGLMVYLKDRKEIKIENIQDLPDDMFEELMKIEKDLYLRLYNYVLGDRIVGINMLFNQISKSELCIHGHIEPIFRDPDELEIGYSYIQERPYDRLSSIINSNIDNSGVLKIPEGIKMEVVPGEITHIKKVLDVYEKTIRFYHDRGARLRNKEVVIQDDIDNLLYNNMVPTPINFVYLTYYKDKYMLSSVPEITSDFVKMDDVTYDPGDLYTLSINRQYTDKDNVFMKHYSPLVRPSVKLYNPNGNNQRVLSLNRKIYGGINGNII